MKLAIKSSKTYTRGPTLNPFENTVQKEGSIFNLQCKRFLFSGKSQECNHFRNNFIYICNQDSVIYLDGWRIGQRDLNRSPPCLFRTISDKFHLDRTLRFVCECGVKTMVSLISRRDIVGKKNIYLSL